MTPVLTIRKRSDGRSGETLEAELAELRSRRDAFAAEHRLLGEDAHRNIDEMLPEARGQFSRLLRQMGAPACFARQPPTLAQLEQLAAVFVMGTPAFAEALHGTVDEARSGSQRHPSGHKIWGRVPGLSPLTGDERDRELAAIDEQSRELQLELERRRLEAARAAVELELAALDGSDAA